MLYCLYCLQVINEDPCVESKHWHLYQTDSWLFYYSRTLTFLFFFLQAKDVQVINVDFNPDFISRLIPRLNWGALYDAAKSVSVMCSQIWNPISCWLAKLGSLAACICLYSFIHFLTRHFVFLAYFFKIFNVFQLGHADDLPAEVVPDFETNTDFLKKTHHVLMEVGIMTCTSCFLKLNSSLFVFPQVEIRDGDLVCPETERKFPIENGIPNMLLRPDEV